MKPFAQGALDSLCGPYSVVNSARGLLGSQLDQRKAEILLERLLTPLIGQYGVKAIVGGTDEDGMEIMLTVLGEEARGFGQPLSVVRPYKADNEPPDAVWSLLAEHVAEHGPGSAIIGLEGRRSHYSAVEKVTGRTIRLLDSAGSPLLRRATTKTKGKHDAKDRIWSSHIWLLRLS